MSFGNRIQFKSESCLDKVWSFLGEISLKMKQLTIVFIFIGKYKVINGISSLVYNSLEIIKAIFLSYLIVFLSISYLGLIDLYSGQRSFSIGSNSSPLSPGKYQMIPFLVENNVFYYKTSL